MKLKTLKRWFSAQNPIMCAIFGPKNGDFQKMLRIVWNGEKCNKIKNFKYFFVSIEYSWIVLFLVLFILGIGKINNTRKMRSLFGCDSNMKLKFFTHFLSDLCMLIRKVNLLVKSYWLSNFFNHTLGIFRKWYTLW